MITNLLVIPPIYNTLHVLIKVAQKVLDKPYLVEENNKL